MLLGAMMFVGMIAGATYLINISQMVIYKKCLKKLIMFLSLLC